MIGKHLKIFILVFALVAASSPAQAQRKKRPARKSNSQLVKEATKARADVLASAKDYKASLETLLALLERDAKSAAEIVEKRKALYEQSIISRKELEEGEQTLATAQALLAQTQKQIEEADNLITEASAAVQIAKLAPVPAGGYRATSALIRYNGAGLWSLLEAGKVENFFLAKFGHSLPVSAFGQTAVHDRLGFDHHNSIDIALHPDSFEGQAVMAYLRSVGIPFIAFRQAVPGSATGAHIHIGYPSRRIR